MSSPLNSSILMKPSLVYQEQEPVALFEARSHGHRYRLHGELGLPRVESPHQGHGLDSTSAKLLRRTGAGGLTGSSAIRHHPQTGWLARTPFGNFIGQDPYAAGDLVTAGFEAGSRPHVQHRRRVRLRQ